VILALLAQAGKNPNNDDIPPELVGVLAAFVCGFLVVLLIVFTFFFLTLSKALSRCHHRNRTMEPGQVWLNFIPLFHLVWMFITANRVSDSLRNEFYDRGWERGEDDYGRGLGTTACVLWIVGGLPYIGVLFGIGWLVCFIIYWVKIANYSSQLASRYDGDYEDDDDRGRRRDDDDDRDDDRDRGRRRGEYDDGY
jgi:hypothetical protein